MFQWRKVTEIMLVFIGLVMTPWLVRAQGTPTFSTLGVDLWPEYDAPGVLVINRATLPVSASLPVELTLRIPADAGEPNAVAVREPGGTLRSVNYTRQIDGEWALINFTATSPEVQIEYYDPGLVKQGNAKQFIYRWPGDYPVDSMTILVQQPVGAKGMTLSPAADSSETGQDGLVYYTKRVGAVAGGQAFNLQVDYQKAADTLSAESLQVKPSAPVTDTPTTTRSLRTALPWILGILGVGLLVGGGLWYWQSGKGKERSEPRRRRRSAAPSEPKAADTSSDIYCHQCGKRAGPGDRFCRACGTRLRVG
jgi:zinc-ribbon domain